MAGKDGEKRALHDRVVRHGVVFDKQMHGVSFNIIFQPGASTRRTLPQGGPQVNAHCQWAVIGPSCNGEVAQLSRSQDGAAHLLSRRGYRSRVWGADPAEQNATAARSDQATVYSRGQRRFSGVCQRLWRPLRLCACAIAMGAEHGLPNVFRARAR